MTYRQLALIAGIAPGVFLAVGILVGWILAKRRQREDWRFSAILLLIAINDLLASTHTVYALDSTVRQKIADVVRVFNEQFGDYVK